jgi:hypothetical protein
MEVGRGAARKREASNRAGFSGFERSREAGCFARPSYSTEHVPALHTAGSSSGQAAQEMLQVLSACRSL